MFRATHLLLLVAALTLPVDADTNPAIVISQVHGDFVELFNRSTSAVSIAGWSIQYTFGNYDTSAFVDWNAIPINGQINSGQYYLVEVDGSTRLSPDAFGYFPLQQLYGTGLNFEGTVALVRSTTPLTVAPPSITDVADLFGYGAGSTADGSPFPGQPTGGTLSFGPQAALRLVHGCQETNNNATDFQLGSPAPRTTQSPSAPCPAVPSFPASGVVNAASFAAGPVAPGELLAIFGTNLGPGNGVSAELTADGKHVATSLGGVQVLFEGVAAPILYASATQINLVAPFELTGESQTTVQVQFNSMTSGSQVLSVAPSAPGVFTSFGTGSGQAAALNQNVTTINSVDFPDPIGSVVVLYATGAGQTSAPGQDGLITSGSTPVPVLPVTVTIGGQNAAVLFAGSAPALVNGTLQVNVRIPAGLTGRQPVVLQVGTAQSQPGVSVAVDLDVTPPQNYFHVDVPAVDIAYDAGTGLLYASVGASASSNPNSIAVIDPSNGNILNWIPTGTGPGKLALSDDGQYLYVVLQPVGGAFQAIQRINLTTGTPDFTVQLKDIYADQNLTTANALQVMDMQVLPGQPRSLAFSATLENDSTAPLVIIDDNVRRPATAASANWLSAGPPGVLWGDTRAYYIAAEGPTNGPLYPVNVDTAPEAVNPAGNVLISSTGLVMSQDGTDLLAELQSPFGDARSFTYRADTGMAYYAGSVSGYTNFLLEAFDLRTWMPAGELFFFDSQVPSNQQFDGAPQRLISVGPSGLATISGGFAPTPRIFIFPLSTIQALPPVTVPQAPYGSADLLEFPIPSNSMTVNPAGDHIYFSVPSVAPPIGNSILPFNVLTQRFESPVFVGSEPDAAAVSADGQHLNVMLDGARSLLRLTLPALTPEKQFHPTYTDGTLLDADVVLSLPSSPTSVVVGRNSAYLSHSYGVAIYDDGIQRPNTTTAYVARRGASGQGPLVDEAQLSADGSTLYGEAGEFEGAQLSQWSVTPQGFQFDAAGTDFGYQLYLNLNCQQTLCLTGSGYLASTTTLQVIDQLGDFANDGLALLDLPNNRMFLLTDSGNDTSIGWYDATTYNLVAQYVISDWGGAYSLNLVAGNQLAIANGDELLLLPLSSTGDQSACRASSPLRANCTRNFRVANSYPQFWRVRPTASVRKSAVSK